MSRKATPRSICVAVACALANTAVLAQETPKPLEVPTAVAQAAPTAVAQATPTAPTAADTAPGGPKLEEIVVTARRMEENLMKVPVAVSVMTAKNIEATGVKSLAEMAQFTPGLFVRPTGTGSVADRSLSRLIFRGLSTSEGTIFIDGAPFSGSRAPDVVDVERVEILNGPQSVYFGRATFAGATNYVTKAPGNDWYKRVSAEIANYHTTDISAMIEGPLVEDRLAFRATARSFKTGGQYTNGLFGEPLGEQSTKAASFAAQFTPSANIKVSTFYSFSQDEDGPAQLASIRAAGSGNLFNCNLGGNGGGYWCGALPDLSQLNPRAIGDYSNMDAFTRRELIDNVRGSPVPFSTSWLDHFGLKRNVHHFHARADFTTASKWDVSFLGAYSQTKAARLLGLNGEPSDLVNPSRPATAAALATACAAPAGSAANAACFTPERVQLTTYALSIVNDASAEVRVSSPQDKWLRATLGASYYRLWGPPTSGFGIQNNGRLANAAAGGIKPGVDTPAIFGGVYADATEKLKLGAEGRYQWDGILRQQTFPTMTAPLEATYKSFSPRLTADYNVTPRSMIYGSYGWGYRPGGFNAALQGLSPFILNQFGALGTQLAYKEEKLTNHEIGHKGTWLNGRMRTTLALYYMKYENGQVPNTQFFLNENGSGGSTTVITNVGQVDLKGLELQADFKATDNLLVSGTLGVADNKIVEYVYTPNGLRIRNSDQVNGNTLDGVPKVSASLSPTYTHKISDNWKGSLRVDFLYRSKVYTDPTNVAWAPARGLVNARVGLARQGGFRLDFFVKNLFDNDSVTSGVRTGDGLYAPSGACPPCYTTARPPIIATGVSALNVIFLGLPEKRTFGVRATYDF